MTLLSPGTRVEKCLYYFCHNMAVQHGFCSTDCMVAASSDPVNPTASPATVDQISRAIDKVVQHKSGAVRSSDVDHLALDLLPSEALKEIAKVLKEGSIKYSPHNWRKGLSYRDTYNHLQNHLLNWIEGDSIEELSHAACNILFLLEFSTHPELYGHLDDRYKHSHTHNK